MNLHVRVLLICLNDLRHIRKIQLRIHAVAEHVHSERYQIHVSRSFAVAEQSSLYPVSACQQSQLGIRHSRSSVVVRMERDYQVFPVVQIGAHVFYL